MLNRIPTQLPPLSLMLDDLGNPKPEKLARALRVGVRTARRWIADDQAPFPVMVAIFWVTRWGVSSVDAEAYNSATQYAGLAESLKSDLAESRRQVARLAQMLDQAQPFDQAANSPLYDLVRPSRPARAGASRAALASDPRSTPPRSSPPARSRPAARSRAASG